MTIGLSKSEIEKRLNAVLLDKLAHITGIDPYEQVTKVVAEIITENNAIIEKDIQEQFRRLRHDLGL